MSVKPILFKTKMVEAILDGQKTQTRRLIKEIPLYEPYFEVYDGVPMACDSNGDWHLAQRFCNIQPGDILYVRETFCIGRVEYGEESDGRSVPYIEQCTDDDYYISKEWALRNDVGIEDVIWKPSIHMPKDAARIFLRVKDVRAERLQEITCQQAIAEGFPSRICGGVEFKYKTDDDKIHTQHGFEMCIFDFSLLWNSTIKPADLPIYGWEANPWVWMIDFEHINARWAQDCQGIIC